MIIECTAEEVTAATDIKKLRGAGCICPYPLLGYRPGVGPRCRLCNVVATDIVEIRMSAPTAAVPCGAFGCVDGYWLGGLTACAKCRGQG